MSGYIANSSLGWLDLDALASERVSTLLRSLQEPTTLDVLGLGTIRDAFSNMLSPGTSTIQTKLRYFIFLPWIFRFLEEEGTSNYEFTDRLRTCESQLIDCLRHLGPNKGVIGYKSGSTLKRMPSEIYWSGLGEWGIRQRNLSLPEYGKCASSLARLAIERDDDGNPTKESSPTWLTDLPVPQHFLHEDLTFELNPEEAQFLAECIQRRHGDSLLAVLCGMSDISINVEFPWYLPTDRLPYPLLTRLHHAQCFSELTLGPQLVYNMLLAQRAGDELGWNVDSLYFNQRTLLEEWSQLVSNRYGVLKQWVVDLPEFWQILAEHRVGNPTRRFVNDVVERAINDPISFMDDHAIHTIIRDREFDLKRERARLIHRAALENWNRDPVGGQLNYRWPITQSYLQDIAVARL